MKTPNLVIVLAMLLNAVIAHAAANTAGFSTSAREFTKISNAVIPKSAKIRAISKKCADGAVISKESRVDGAKELNRELSKAEKGLNKYVKFINLKDQKIKALSAQTISPKNKKNISVDKCGQDSAKDLYAGLNDEAKILNSEVNGKEKISQSIESAIAKIKAKSFEIKVALLSCETGGTETFESALSDLEKLAKKAKEVEKNANILASQFKSNVKTTVATTEACDSLVAANDEPKAKNAGVKPKEEKSNEGEQAKQDNKGQENKENIETRRLASQGKDKENYAEFLKETEMVKQSQANTAASAQTEHYTALKKFADEQGIELPKNCLKGVFGSCANHIAAMRQLHLQGNTSLYNDYLDKLKNGSVKVGVYKFEYFGAK